MTLVTSAGHYLKVRYRQCLESYELQSTLPPPQQNLHDIFPTMTTSVLYYNYIQSSVTLLAPDSSQNPDANGIWICIQFDNNDNGIQPQISHSANVANLNLATRALRYAH